MRLVSRALYSCCFALLLAGCSRSPERAVDIDVVGDESALFETGARLSDAGRLVRSATSEGIVSLDEQGRVIPGLADRWIITDDGLSYIFRLRDGLWLDGAAITGENVRPALRQALATDSCNFINNYTQGSTPTAPEALGAPLIEDCGALHTGNQQIHPSTSATCTSDGTPL